ncbi:hypothetical protein [Streptomyces violaceorubidus]|uniref:hypothetical protein n=1 Tax=Streptomyces violaceorubidus TaxID=284042 RepID=UPI0004C0E2F6|nr:hypothetical protein [Streptomyces violaceorubidus]
MNEERRGWRPTRNQKIVGVLVLLLVWTVAANRWTDKGCQLGQSYRLVVTHGAPERYEGCVEEGRDRVEYTDDYYG